MLGVLEYALAGALSFGGPVDPEIEAEAVAAEREADEAFRTGDYPRAKAKVSEANRLRPASGHLWMLAEIERYEGNCNAAVILYRQYYQALDEPTPQARDAVGDALEACGEELEREPPPSPQPEPAPAPSITEPTPPTRAPVSDSAPSRRRPDATTIVLSTVGSAGIIAGASLLGVGIARGLDASTTATDEADFFAARDRARSLRVVGGSVLGVSTALLVTAIVRLAIVSRRRKATRARELGPQRPPSVRTTSAREGSRSPFRSERGRTRLDRR